DPRRPDGNAVVALAHAGLLHVVDRIDVDAGLFRHDFSLPPRSYAAPALAARVLSIATDVVSPRDDARGARRTSTRAVTRRFRAWHGRCSGERHQEVFR